MSMDKERSDGPQAGSEGLPLFALLKGLEQVAQPFSDLLRQIPTIRVPAIEKDSAVGRLIAGQQRFAVAVKKLGIGSLATAAGKLARHVGNAEALDKAGWLPHHSMPFDRIDECEGDAEAVNALLSRYYRDGWSEVCRDIEARLKQCDVDDQTKETFREALEAHEAGLYRSVCAVLIPGIERVSRIELHENRMDTPVTNQNRLRELASELPISSIEPGGFFALKLYQRLSMHLYERVNDECGRNRFTQDPVPNRHAVVHGYVVYSSMQSSLNTIFMANFILQVIGVLKTRGRPRAT